MHCLCQHSFTTKSFKFVDQLFDLQFLLQLKSTSISGYRMRSIDFGFNEGDVDNVDRIIDSINDLVHSIFLYKSL